MVGQAGARRAVGVIYRMINEGKVSSIFVFFVSLLIVRLGGGAATAVGHCIAKSIHPHMLYLCIYVSIVWLGLQVSALQCNCSSPILQEISSSIHHIIYLSNDPPQLDWWTCHPPSGQTRHGQNRHSHGISPTIRRGHTLHHHEWLRSIQS